MKVLIIFAVTIIAMICLVLFKPKLKIGKITVGTYYLAVLIGAALLLCLKGVPLEAVAAGLTAHTAVNPLKILTLFISMTILSIFLDEVGFFKNLATATLRKCNKSQTKLFLALYFMVSVLTVFTSNDIIILTFTPFICYFCKNAKISPYPYLFAEFIGANTWSMALIIGNPTNIYLASSQSIGFFEYFSVMALPTVAGGLVSLLILFLTFKRPLKEEISISVEQTEKLDRGLLIIGLTHLSLCTLALVFSDLIKIEMYAISLFFALSLFLFVSVYKLFKKQPFTELKKTLARAPWELIPFVLSMFVFVLALSNQGLTSDVAHRLGESNPVFKYGALSYLTANLINNIPMSVLFADVLNFSSAAIKTQAVYASIVGSNLGALLTPIGALAGIMWSSIVEKQGYKLCFSKFLKYGIIVSLPSLLATLSVLLLTL